MQQQLQLPFPHPELLEFISMWPAYPEHQIYLEKIKGERRRARGRGGKQEKEQAKRKETREKRNKHEFFQAAFTIRQMAPQQSPLKEEQEYLRHAKIYKVLLPTAETESFGAKLRRSKLFLASDISTTLLLK